MTLATHIPQQHYNGALMPMAQPEPPSQVVRLAEWAQAAQAAYQVAESLVETSFVPAAFRRKPHEACAAILAGSEVGLSPMASLRAFDVIQGTAAPRAMTLRAIVQSRGHDVWVEESTDSRAIVCGQRAGSSRVEKSVWTTDRARGLNLTGKDNWKNQPKAMLIARATSEVCRLIAADAILGLAYSAEELGDGAMPDDQPIAEQVTAPAVEQTSSKRTARRTATSRKTTRSAPPDEHAEPVGPPLPGEEEFVATEAAEAARDRLRGVCQEEGIDLNEVARDYEHQHGHPLKEEADPASINAFTMELLASCEKALAEQPPSE